MTATKVAAVVVVGSAAIAGAAVYRSSAQPSSASRAPTKIVERADVAVAMAPPPARPTAPVDLPAAAPPPVPPSPAPPGATAPTAPARAVAQPPDEAAPGPVVDTEESASEEAQPANAPADAAVVASAPADAGVEVPAVDRAVVDASPEPGTAALAIDAGSGRDAVHFAARLGPGLPVDIHPSQLKAQQISGDTDVPASAATRKCMQRYHLDGLQGTVGLCVDERGLVSASTMNHPSDCDEYNQQLLHAVRGWRYRPYVVDGHATAVCSTVEFMYANH